MVNDSTAKPNARIDWGVLALGTLLSCLSLVAWWSAAGHYHLSLYGPNWSPNNGARVVLLFFLLPGPVYVAARGDRKTFLMFVCAYVVGLGALALLLLRVAVAGLIA
jgi:hypothetical protein